MAADMDNFWISGPKHAIPRGSRFASVDWDRDDHRRCVAACLVKGAYVLESDRAARRVGAAALAPAWWETFHFRLARPALVDDADNSIFAAVFEYVPPAGARRHPSVPRYVAAFRGTMPRPGTFRQDLHLDFRIVVNDLHRTSRARLASRAVEDVVNGGGNVWLCGHSLGASIAMLAGKHVARQRRVGLPAFLFNPPHVSPSPAIDMVAGPASKSLRFGIRASSGLLKAGLAATEAFRGHRDRTARSFEQVATWTPDLYVHVSDAICSGYVDYFEARTRMPDGDVARLAARTSYRDLLRTALGEESERLHLLPAARMWVSSSDVKHVEDAHGLRQWWRPDGELSLTVKQCSYK